MHGQMSLFVEKRLSLICVGKEKILKVHNKPYCL